MGLSVGSVGRSGRRALTRQAGPFSSLGPSTYHLTPILRILRVVEAKRNPSNAFGPCRQLVFLARSIVVLGLVRTACLKSQTWRVGRVSPTRSCPSQHRSRLPPKTSIDVDRIFVSLRALYVVLPVSFRFVTKLGRLARLDLASFHRWKWQRDPSCRRRVVYTSCLFLAVPQRCKLFGLCLRIVRLWFLVLCAYMQ